MTGAYTDIVDIVVQDSAVAGELVSALVEIKNTHTASVHIWCSVSLGGPIFWFDTEEHYWTPAGVTVSFLGHFTMPSSDVTILAYSYYEIVGGWRLDDEMSKVVKLSTVTPAKGVISKKELKYNGTQKAIPVSIVPQGDSGQIHVWGRSTSTDKHTMTMEWTVTDPVGAVPEQHSEPEGMVPNEEHHFIGGRFDLSIEGVYSIAIRWLAGSTVLDSYSGNLCTVTRMGITEFTIEDFVKV